PPVSTPFPYTTLFRSGLVGVTGAYILSRVPEPRGQPLHENLFRLLRHPLKDPNFRRLMAFNSAWVFAVNLATPFFTVFLLKSLRSEEHTSELQSRENL